jgi:hypothetical protein
MSRSSSRLAFLPTSISPRCSDGDDRDDSRRLAGTVVPNARVTVDERDEMYALLQGYFAGTDRARFEADLREKEAVILLRDARSERIKGFSTLMRLTLSIGEQDIVAFFSGDTIVDRDYWGETLLSRIWGQTVFAEADRILGASPAATIYWFLICSGYKTWRFLPVFFREFYPNPSMATPPHVQHVLDSLGARKFGDQYHPGSGIVRFRDATPLRHGVASVTDERLRDPHVAFFARKNPGHADGDELACLAELSRSNLTRAALRMISRPL